MVPTSGQLLQSFPHTNYMYPSPLLTVLPLHSPHHQLLNGVSVPALLDHTLRIALAVIRVVAVLKRLEMICRRHKKFRRRRDRHQFGISEISAHFARRNDDNFRFILALTTGFSSIKYFLLIVIYKAIFTDKFALLVTVTISCSNVGLILDTSLNSVFSGSNL